MSGTNSRFRDQYKKNILVSNGGGKYKRAKKKLEDRRVSRIEHFSRQRNLVGLIDDSETVRTAVDSRKFRLQKWKEEKVQKKLLMKASEKPVFKCGIVHHKLGSPYLNDISNVSHIKKVPTLAKLRQKTDVVKKNPVTKQSFAPSDFKFKPPKIRPAVLIEEESRVNVSDRKKGVLSIKNEFTLQLQENPLRRVTRAQTRACGGRVQYHFPTIPKATNKQMHKSSQIPQSRSTSKIDAPVIKKSNTEKSATPVSTEVVRGSDTPKPDIEAEVPVVEDIKTEEHTGPTNREAVERNDTPKAEAMSCTPVRTQCFPIEYSPFVNKGRGSSSRRSHYVSEQNPREVSAISCEREKLGSPVLSSNAVDTAEENRQHGVLYFRSVLESEARRLQTLCQEWLHIQSSMSDLPPETSDLICSAVGQTQLLLRKKFSQFHGLIDRCEKFSKFDTTGAPVTCSDLDGFWDLVYMQVEDVDLRFSKLEKLKLNNWKDVVCEEVKQPVARRLKKVTVKKPTKSSLRTMIAAARKRKQTEASEGMGFVSMNAACTPERVAITRTGSTPLLSRRSQTSLLQHTLLEEHRKHSRGVSWESSPIIMKVTQIAKMCDAMVTSTVQVLETADAPSPCKTTLPNQKPSKSILKSVTCYPPVPSNTTLNNGDESAIDESIMKIQHSAVETKDKEVFKLKRSLRSVTRSVRFEGAGDNTAKGIHTVTPYISHSHRPKWRNSQRISLLGSPEVNTLVTTPLPSGDLICLDSPVSVPHQVIRRSLRLSKQVQN